MLILIAAAEVAVADSGTAVSSASGATMRHGLRAYADPETGEAVQPAPADTVAATGSGGAETALLEMVPAPTDVGGVMVDLRGRFRHETRARTVDGKLSADCIPTTSPP